MAPDPLSWPVSPALVDDVREVIGTGPVATADQRFEKVAWRALLDQVGGPLLTRGCAPAHLTASAAVLSPDGSHTCLVLHHRIRKWVQPGGHFEAGDETGRAAAEREVREETGLSGGTLAWPALLSRHPAPCRPGVVDWHLDLQFVLLAEMVPPVPSDESPQVAWWPVTALPADTAGGVPELVQAAVELYSR